MASAVPTNPRSELVTRIMARVDASSQLLMILIGLGITNAVVKFGENITRPLCAETLVNPPSPTPENCLHHPIGLEVYVLFFVFFFYATRFFFNNWVYLRQSYRQDLLETEAYSYSQLETVFRCAHFDLMLSIVTGATCAFAGTLLSAVPGPPQTGLELILILLVFHYIFDLVILLHNWWYRRAEEQQSENEDVRQALLQVILWVGNNAIFLTIFASFVAFLLLGYVKPKTRLVDPFIILWFLNSLIAVSITSISSRPEMKRHREKHQSQPASTGGLGSETSTTRLEVVAIGAVGRGGSRSRW
jgi:hypothetical protein